MQRYLLIKAFLTGVCGLLLFAPRATAQMTFCNNTGYPITVAVAYKGDYDARDISLGWWNIEGGHCKEVLTGTLAEYTYYYYAEDHARNLVWKGDQSFCVSRHAFKIVGSSNCDTRGYESKKFQSLYVGSARSWTQNFTD